MRGVDRAGEMGALRRVVVSGVGSISAVGGEWQEVARALREGKDGTGPVRFFSVEGCQSRSAGQVEDLLLPEVGGLGGRRAHRVSRMLWHGWQKAAERRPGFVPDAVLFGTTSGGMSEGEEFYHEIYTKKKARDFRGKVRDYMPQQAALDLVEANGWEVAPQIVSNACASGTNAVGQAWQLVASGAAERVVCGGYDALARLVFMGFDSLRAASPEKCRPFDKNRTGLLLGEGAAVLLLESEDSADAAGARPLARVAGYGAFTDTHHLTQPDPSGKGPFESMREALRVAGCAPEEVGYVNAHGTATPINDACEGRAIARLFPGGVPVSSTKALTGHALGAAGAIEAVFCVMALVDGFCPVQANLREADPELPLRLVLPGGAFPPPKKVLSNSFGFGGSNASVLFEAV